MVHVVGISFPMATRFATFLMLSRTGEGHSSALYRVGARAVVTVLSDHILNH